MPNLLGVGVRALQANQIALQTAGNNIANVNTPGYSRQSAVLEDVPGQFSGSGYYGQGVTVTSIERTYSQFLTRQAALSKSLAASDISRLEKLTQLEDIFQGGSGGVGASMSDMLNAYSDVANAPTDLTARTVVLTRANEAAARFRTASNGLEALQSGTREGLTQSVATVNSLAQRIAAVNAEVAKALGTGQSPNQLLDQRDQLVNDLNKLVQTTSIKADDGTVGIFLAGSQALVLGNTASKVQFATTQSNPISQGNFNDPDKVQLQIVRGSLAVNLDENSLGGGEMSGLMRFHNTDIAEARDLLGRLALSINTVVNNQHKLGVDLDGQLGKDLFTPITLKGGIAATGNLGTATMSVAVSATVADAANFAASEYQIQFTGAGTGNVIRLSDGQVTAFAGVPTQVIDGLVFSSTGGEAAGDSFKFKPYSTPAGDMNVAFSSARSLAVANRIEPETGIPTVPGSPNTPNKGGMSVVSLLSKVNDPDLTQTVTLVFDGAGNYTATGTGVNLPDTKPYISGTPISYNGWEFTLKGAPQPGDTFKVKAATPGYSSRNAGNADGMMALRDLSLFDGAALTDGYAGLMATVGTRVQSGKIAAEVSEAIATNIEKDRAGVSGVNLDEEAAKLLQFQQAYQASAKLIQIAQNVFDTMIQSLGR